MKAYKINKYVMKIECDNCLVIIHEALTDSKGRPVVSIQINPDDYAGENKNKRVGGCGNVRVITLKTKRK